MSIICRVMIVVMLLASVMPASAAMPMMQDYGVSNPHHSATEPANSNEAVSHCEQMMAQTDAAPMTVMMDCDEECDCCSNACNSVFIHSSVKFATKQTFLLMSSNSHSSAFRTIESLYRPPIIV